MNRTNFPGRKNRRRVEARDRLVAHIKNGHATFAQKLELQALSRRIVSPAQALNTFSKKWRGVGDPPVGSRASK